MVMHLDFVEMSPELVPFLQNISGNAASPNWVMRLFILRSDNRATYTGGINGATDPNNFPKVYAVNATASGSVFTAAGTGLEPGDLVMDNNGNYHTVTEVNGNNITVVGGVSLTHVTVVLYVASPHKKEQSVHCAKVFLPQIPVLSTPFFKVTF